MSIPCAVRPVRLARRVGWGGIVAACSAGAGAIHLAAAGSHLQEWRAAGASLALAGSFQLTWAAWVTLGARRAVIRAGAAVNAGIIALWAVSRTVGLPIGPEPWMPEHVHATDLLATGLETLLIIGVLVLARPRAFAPGPALVSLALLASAAAVVVAEHDPVRERLVAVAALVIGATARALVPHLLEAVSSTEGRRHAFTTIGSRPTGVGTVVRAAGSPR